VDIDTAKAWSLQASKQGFADFSQARRPAEPNDAFQIEQLLGDPQTDVRCAGDQCRVGKPRVERGERVEARGRGEEAPLVADEEVPVVGERGQSRPAFVCRRDEAIGRSPVAGRKRRVDDRPIAGAAAEIPCKLVAQAGWRRRRPRMVGREQAHDDARRAKSALRTVMVDHRLLQGVQSRALGERALEELSALDPMAAARFASVFSSFEKAEDYARFFGSLAGAAAPSERDDEGG